RDLPEFILQHHRSRAVKNAQHTAEESGRVFAELRSASSRLDADQSDGVVLQHLEEESDRIRAAPNARDGDIRQSAGTLADLPEGLATDDRLEVAHDHRIRLLTEHRAEVVVRC